ncbi:hypothetical protein CROQUDRAFT_717147 [Cronartium quercuum f. sp. fusiforme G11]|uniref:Uncharacterized protein n=1 Tax=Cronartium quercuum f. sp. fusiforme G11 TaxID=708437 RepID=A0A9P6NG58_9BASI|nr:hypothetical protein CROQUDRAFT_717147 [Cronartium quercuum f. sp. fusiforme G11]
MFFQKTPAWLHKLFHLKQSTLTSKSPATQVEMSKDQAQDEQHKTPEDSKAQFTIQPFPANTNNPADLLKNPELTDLNNTAQLTGGDSPVFAQPGPQILDPATAASLKVEDNKSVEGQSDDK